MYEGKNSQRVVFLDSRSSSASVSRQQLEYEKEQKPTTVVDAVSAAALKKKKKKSHLLVRKLSLNKFRLSSEQESRQTPPEGSDSSRSQSQSSQESPMHSYSPTGIGKKRQEDDTLEREKAKGELEKSEKQLKKPVKTVIVVQRSPPSLTIKNFSRTVQQGEVVC